MVVSRAGEETLVDFADIYVLAQHFGKEALMGQAQTLDAGFDLSGLAQMIRTIKRFDYQEIPLAAHDLSIARTFFTDWAGELS